MTGPVPSVVDPLICKIESHFDLSSQERKTLENLPVHIRVIAAHEPIVREDDRPSQCCIILAGLACRARILDNGARQILSFHLPGDVPDLQSWHMDRMDHDLVMLQAGRVGFVPHTAISHLMERHPRIAIALWRETLIDAAVAREWLVGIGRKSAYARLAHLFCELVARSQAIEQEVPTLEFYPRQNELADAIGISLVHINRTMRELRADGLISVNGRRLTILDWDGLKKAGQFDATYLRLEHAVRRPANSIAPALASEPDGQRSPARRKPLPAA